MINAAMKLPVFLCVALSPIIAFHAYAATRTTTITEIKRGKNIETRTEVLTIDKNNARLDMYNGTDILGKNAPYFLTNDGGRTWVLNDLQHKKRLCSNWDTKLVFAHVGKLIYFVEEFVNAEVSEGKFDVRLDEPGPVMLGYKTRHLKIDHSINAKASFLFFSREYTLSFKDEIWTSPDLRLSPIEQSWVDAIGKTGYKKLDRLTQSWNQTVHGTVLRMVSDVTLHNITKNEKQTKREIFAVAKLETVNSEDLAADTFRAQECRKATSEEMEEAAKNMLKELAK